MAEITGLQRMAVASMDTTSLLTCRRILDGTREPSGLALWHAIQDELDGRRAQNPDDEAEAWGERAAAALTFGGVSALVDYLDSEQPGDPAPS